MVFVFPSNFALGSTKPNFLEIPIYWNSMQTRKIDSICFTNGQKKFPHMHLSLPHGQVDFKVLLISYEVFFLFWEELQQKNYNGPLWEELQLDRSLERRICNRFISWSLTKVGLGFVCRGVRWLAEGDGGEAGVNRPTWLWQKWQQPKPNIWVLCHWNCWNCRLVSAWRKILAVSLLRWRLLLLGSHSIYPSSHCRCCNVGTLWQLLVEGIFCCCYHNSLPYAHIIVTAEAKCHKYQ